MDFLPCSYGFRPNRRAHDAVAEIRHFTSHSSGWIVEGDIKACFDEISHSAVLDRVRARIGDKRVLVLVKAFLKAGILGEDRQLRENNAGTPQGSILSPLLSNVALSVLDEYIAQPPGGPGTSRVERAERRRHGLPNYQPVLRLYLSRTQGRQGRDGKDEGTVWQNRPRPAARRPAHPAQPDVTGLVRLLPPRGVGRDLQLPGPLCAGPGHQMAATQTPPDHLEGAPSPLWRIAMATPPIARHASALTRRIA